MTDALVVLCTVPSADKGAELARALVDERVAACINILPGVRSIYHWQGKVEDESEALLLIKTTRARFAVLRERLLALHPYSVPELLALPVEEGAAPYLAWLASETSADSRAQR